jgi:hypothetical protein
VPVAAWLSGNVLPQCRAEVWCAVPCCAMLCRAVQEPPKQQLLQYESGQLQQLQRLSLCILQTPPEFAVYEALVDICPQQLGTAAAATVVSWTKVGMMSALLCSTCCCCMCMQTVCCHWGCLCKHILGVLSISSLLPQLRQWLLHARTQPFPNTPSTSYADRWLPIGRPAPRHTR